MYINNIKKLIKANANYSTCSLGIEYDRSYEKTARLRGIRNLSKCPGVLHPWTPTHWLLKPRYAPPETATKWSTDSQRPAWRGIIEYIEMFFPNSWWIVGYLWVSLGYFLTHPNIQREFQVKLFSHGGVLWCLDTLRLSSLEDCVVRCPPDLCQAPKNTSLEGCSTNTSKAKNAAKLGTTKKP